MHHFIKLFARTAEQLTRAQATLREKMPGAFMENGKAPYETHELATHTDPVARECRFAVLLDIADGKDISAMAQLAEQAKEALMESGTLSSWPQKEPAPPYWGGKPLFARHLYLG